MGVVGSKSPLERRNTVLRRSQRKSIHGVKSKAEKLKKDIKKFKGTEENSDYIELKARIEQAERELKIQSRNLQPQVNFIYNDALKKTEECHQLLSDKLIENQDKELKEAVEKPPENNDEDDVFVEEVPDEEPDERKTVEVKVIQVENIETSPQVNKRFSAVKMGVPVLPGSIMESMHKKTEEINSQSEEKIAKIRQQIENVEMEISTFVGHRNGRHYFNLLGKLQGLSDELRNIPASDDEIQEQVKRSGQYIASCISFLNEKAVDEDSDDSGEVFTDSPEKQNADSNLSPRSIRTTYI